MPEYTTPAGFAQNRVDGNVTAFPYYNNISKHTAKQFHRIFLSTERGLYGLSCRNA